MPVASLVLVFVMEEPFIVQNLIVLQIIERDTSGRHNFSATHALCVCM